MRFQYNPFYKFKTKFFFNFLHYRASSQNLDHCLYEFGTQLYMSATLLDIFHRYFLRSESPVCFELLKWYHTFGKSNSEKQQLVDSSLHSIDARIATEIITCNSTDSQKYLQSLQLAGEVSIEQIDKLRSIIQQCPIKMSDDYLSDEFSEHYMLWKSKCQKLYNDTEFTRQFPITSNAIGVCAGNSELFDELEPMLNVRDPYKIFLLKKVHENFEMTREEFSRMVKLSFFGEFDDLFNFEKAIIEAFKGDATSFLIYSTYFFFCILVMYILDLLL